MDDAVVLLRKAPAHVGPTAQHHHIVDCHLGTRDGLRDKGHPTGYLPMGHRQQILIVHPDVAAAYPQDLIEALEHGALAGTVVAENGQKFSILQGETDLTEDLGAASVMKTEILNVQHFRALP